MSNDTLNDIQDYLENLCALHTDLLHGVAGRKAFARFKTDETITEISHAGTDNIVVVAEVNGHRIGDVDDKEIRRGVVLIFASKASTDGNKAQEVDAATKKAEDIMFDFINRMQLDQENECGLDFDLEKISWSDLDGPWLEFYYGWLLFLPFKGYLPAYDTDKWSDS